MNSIKNQVGQHLQKVCAAGPRPIGSESIQQAEAYIKQVFKECGLDVKRQEFGCFYWDCTNLNLFVDGENLPAIPNTFTPSCDITAPLVLVGSVQELEQSYLEGRIAVLYDKLSAEPLAPKNFAFWNPEEHQKIIQLLEIKKPEAIITISPRIYSPVPILEDWDFKIPSATVSAKTGLSLLRNRGQQATLQISSKLMDSVSANIIGRTKLPVKKKIVICAHYDTKYDTVGAFDNGSGTAALLTIAQSLAQKDLPINIELIAFAGEETYALGELAYLEKYESDFQNIQAAINIDGIGLPLSSNSIAFFEWPEELAKPASELMVKCPSLVQIDPWPQGDHTIFWLKQVPSIAFSADLGSKVVIDLVQTISHTPKDTIEWVSPEKIDEVVESILELIDVIAAHTSGIES